MIGLNKMVLGYGFTDRSMIPAGSVPVDDFTQDYIGESVRPNVWDYPFASVAALGVASFGMKKRWEYFFAVFGQFIYWLQGFKGLDGLMLLSVFNSDEGPLSMPCSRHC